MSNYRPDGALLTSANEEWFTPQVVIDGLREFSGLAAEPAFDPCGHPSHLFATCTVLQEKFRDDPRSVPEWPRSVIFGDGLALDWSGRGLTFCNPPYGRDINRWLARGRLRVPIDRVLPLEGTAEAHRLQEESTVGLSGAVGGKIVIEP